MGQRKAEISHLAQNWKSPFPEEGQVGQLIKVVQSGESESDG